MELKNKVKKKRRKKKIIGRLRKAYKKQIVGEVLRLSRKDISSECLNAPPIKPTHKLFPNGEHNDAMIGKGLWLNHLNYQEGYIGVAIRLLDIIRLSDNIIIKDSYILVALFCFRHYLELSMKDSLLHYYKEHSSAIIMDCGHNLEALFNEIMKLPGMYSDETTDSVKRMVNTLHGYDPTGIVFRYPYNLEASTGSVKTTLMPKIGLKDVRTLRVRMMQLYNFFDGINWMVHDYERKGRYCKTK